MTLHVPDRKQLPGPGRAAGLDAVGSPPRRRVEGPPPAVVSYGWAEPWLNGVEEFAGLAQRVIDATVLVKDHCHCIT